jgi:putative N6-adenine-specific DNA methylase
VPAPPRHEALAVCAPGLEALVVAELAALGIRSGRPAGGAVPFRASTRQLYAANLWLRCAERVQVRVATFGARTFADLERGASRVDWGRFVVAGQPAVVRASSSASRLVHTGAVAERILAAAGTVEPDDRHMSGSDDDDPLGRHPVVRVRLVRDQATVSIDASGAPLHRRGWRLAAGKAPLRETVAAAALAAVGWDGTTPLIDPFCGAGTIAIEAALIARRLPPGQGRSFGFQHWPSFEPGTWASVRGEATGRALERSPVAIIAADRDAGAVQATTANAERAGVAGDLDAHRASISDLQAPVGTTTAGAGWLVTNPPWGQRVKGAGDLRDLYARLGSVAADRLRGWAVALVLPATPDAQPLVAATGLPLGPVLTTASAGTPLAVLSTRRPPPAT